MKLRAVAAWLLAVPATAWAVMRLGGLERGYPLVQVMTFTPYAAVAAGVAAIVAAVLRRRVAAVVAAVSALALAIVVAPRVLNQEGTAARGPTLRVLSANVYFSKVRARDLVALARRERADLVSVQELTPELDAELARAFPHRIADPRPGAFGTGLYSRFPLRRVPGPRDTRHAQSAAEARLPGGRTIRIVAVHPHAPLGRGSMAGWKHDLRALPPARPRTILAGDFNASIDHRELRRLIDTGYRVAAEEAGVGLVPTWRGSRRWLPAVTIDHVLVGSGIATADAAVHDLPGSDHNAVTAELVVR
ncbi:MAG TPA: endonuclease/exonuclease/phosphatase family protein [Solirubrobacteraceae bacterium]